MPVTYHRSRLAKSKGNYYSSSVAFAHSTIKTYQHPREEREKVLHKSGAGEPNIPPSWIAISADGERDGRCQGSHGGDQGVDAGFVGGR